MCIGLEKGTLKLVPFSKNWKRFFNEEKHILLDIIGDFILDIEHIGGTAIEGALAKPIIDILISLKSVVKISICFAISKKSDL